jgi:hypothetical protein
MRIVIGHEFTNGEYRLRVAIECQVIGTLIQKQLTSEEGIEATLKAACE